MISFSVIIPMFNAARLLHESVESVLSQTYENFELILVDDGSTDHTREVAQGYMNKDNRIRLIENKHIGRASAMRNIGLREAKNDYIVFVDSDDKIIPSALEQIADSLDDNHLPDVLCCSILCGTYDSDENFNLQKRIVNFQNFDMSCTGKEALLFLANSKATMKCHSFANIYSRTFLLKNSLFQFEKLLFLEDHEWMLRVFYHADNVCAIDFAYYFYIMRDGSITGTCSINRINDELTSTALILQFMHQHKNELSVPLRAFWAAHALRCFNWECFEPHFYKSVGRKAVYRALRNFFSDKEKRKLLFDVSKDLSIQHRLGIWLASLTRFGVMFPAECFFAFLRFIRKGKVIVRRKQ